MTNEEFSNEFDALVSSNAIAKPFELGNTLLEFDEYEKSMFLTKAQETVIKSLYNGTLVGEAFEKTEELRRYLSNLVKTYSTTQQTTGIGLTEESYFFSIPEDTWFITYESVKSSDDKLGCAKGAIMEVIPVSQDELYKTKRNPFRMPNKRRVLRLDIKDNIVELVSVYTIDEYTIRYIAEPKPIILSTLPKELSINKLTTETKCELNPALHRTILEMAVKLAINSRANVGK